MVPSGWILDCPITEFVPRLKEPKCVGLEPRFEMGPLTDSSHRIVPWPRARAARLTQMVVIIRIVFRLLPATFL